MRSETRNKILTALREHGTLTADELNRYVGTSSWNLHDHIRRLKRDGEVRTIRFKPGMPTRSGRFLIEVIVQ